MPDESQMFRIPLQDSAATASYRESGVEVLPFDPNKLVASSISENHRGTPKLFESEDCPNKIIRVEHFRDIEERHKGKLPVREIIAITRNLYQELKERYGFHIPVDFYLAKGDVSYAVVDKIDGRHLGGVERSDEFISQAGKLYASIAEYFLDRLNEGGPYLWDINGPTQYTYGRKAGDSENKIYLIDTDLWLGNTREGLCLCIFWLAKHMRGLELSLRQNFREARTHIARFIERLEKIDPELFKSKNIEETRKLLSGKESAYEPESAIPAFE